MKGNQTARDVVAEGLGAIKAAGGRSTTTKRLVLETFSSRPGHLTAEDVTAAVQVTSPDVASSTIYRILEELERVGVVEHSHPGKGPAIYHLHHHAHGHLVCQRCGAMIEADLDLFSQLSQGALDRHGFTVDPHHFAVLGECRQCHSSEPATQAPH